MAKHGVKPATVRQHANLLKAGFGTAVARRKLAYDPSHGLLLPKVQRTERDCFSPVELRTFFAGTKDTWLGPLWLTLGTTGMRPGEVCALTWEDWNGNTLRISKGLSADPHGALVASPTKTNRMRNVLLPESTAAVLRSHRKRMLEQRLKAHVWERPDLLFPNTRGRQYTPTVLNHLFAKEVARLGLKKVPLYSLRHAHATDLLSQGTNPKVVAERLGHSNVGITLNTYSHVVPGIQEDTMASFDKSLTSTPHPKESKG
jgi:integrase